jgi:hypothetical protein
MPALSLRTPPLCIKLSPPRLATHRCTIFAYQPVTPVSPFFATLTRHLQPAENNATLSGIIYFTPQEWYNSAHYGDTTARTTLGTEDFSTD